MYAHKNAGEKFGAGAAEVEFVAECVRIEFGEQRLHDERSEMQHPVLAFGRGSSDTRAHLLRDQLQNLRRWANNRLRL